LRLILITVVDNRLIVRMYDPYLCFGFLVKRKKEERKNRITQNHRKISRINKIQYKKKRNHQ